MKPQVNLVWFKRDLRVHDHLPLYNAAQEPLPLLPLYVVEPLYWQQPFASRRHWHFIHDSLTELRRDCQTLGQTLIVRQGDVVEVLAALAQILDIQRIYAHEETSNGWTFERDKAVLSWCQAQQVPLVETPTNGVVRRLKSRDSWASIRHKRMAQPLVPKPAELPPLPVTIEAGDIPDKHDPLFGPAVPGVTQPGGRRSAIATLKSFLEERGQHYLYTLSAPGSSEHHCSRLSPHLTWGTLSAKEVEKSLQRRLGGLSQVQQQQWRRHLAAFSARLAWRCHFMQKLEDQPNIEYACIHPAYEGLRDEDFNPDYYRAWACGETGYPFVDACMKNLIHEGWITFRMRAMLVSFASYQLWLDWRKTGYHLAQLFTDYEPGIHYSQLQMQSGVTGINAMRVYNPVKQSHEHDPDGTFIKRWLPQLAKVPTAWVHEPWKLDIQQQQQYQCLIGEDYPAPIVDNTAAAKLARQAISEVRKQSGFKQVSDAIYHKLGSRKLSPSKRKKHQVKRQAAKSLQQQQMSLFSEK